MPLYFGALLEWVLTASQGNFRRMPFMDVNIGQKVKIVMSFSYLMRKWSFNGGCKLEIKICVGLYLFKSLLNINSGSSDIGNMYFARIKCGDCH